MARLARHARLDSLDSLDKVERVESCRDEPSGIWAYTAKICLN